MDTKGIILNAVVQLVSKKGISNVTVQDIIEQASVSRRTFYKYYTDKYDAMNSYFSWEIEKSIKNKFNGKNWEEIAIDIGILLRDHANYFSEVAHMNSLDSFYHYLRLWAEDTYTSFYMKNTGKDRLNEEEEILISIYSIGNLIYVEKILKEPDKYKKDSVIRDFIRMALKNVPEIYYTIL